MPPSSSKPRRAHTRTHVRKTRDATVRAGRKTYMCIPDCACARSQSPMDVNDTQRPISCSKTLFRPVQIHKGACTDSSTHACYTRVRMTPLPLPTAGYTYTHMHEARLHARGVCLRLQFFNSRRRSLTPVALKLIQVSQFIAT